MENYDPNLFEPVILTPITKVYRIKDIDGEMGRLVIVTTVPLSLATLIKGQPK